MKGYVEIEGNNYLVYYPENYEEIKLLRHRIKRVFLKIRYYNKMMNEGAKNVPQAYYTYPILYDILLSIQRKEFDKSLIKTTLF